jgi:hypothetical protein
MSSWLRLLAASGPASSAAQAHKAAHLKQALDSNTRAFSLADQARGTAQQKRLLQVMQGMSRDQAKMRAATKL